MNKTAVLAALGAIVIAGTVAAALVLRSDGEATEQARATSQPVVEIAVSPRPTASPTPRPGPTPLPDRTDCAQIKGTPYRSDAERAYYLANCTTAPPAGAAAAPSISVDTSAACSTDIKIATSRSDETFDVTGLTVDEINASLQANGPLVDAEVAAGLTEYEYRIDGTYCTTSRSCTMGDVTIHADIVVTLPNLTTFDQLSAGLKPSWTRFANMVEVHETRHVTIIEEGLAEIRRQLLIVAQQPDCGTLDHEVERVWTLYTSQMEQRQAAFHAADSVGQGGSVVR
jgi:predicted secreted Zn-dependent protease